jgi:mRNA interferase MazF
VKIEPDMNNGLSKISAVDTLQIRGLDTQRLIKKLGKVSATKMAEILLAILALIEYEQESI